MTISEVRSDTYLADSIIFIRDFIRDNVTDPIAAGRPAKERFVMTSYPERGVRYPLITVRLLSTSPVIPSGMRSELQWTSLIYEVRLWATTTQQREEISQEIINELRANQFPPETSGTFTNANLFDFEIQNTTDIDEEGKAGIHSRVIQIKFNFMLGS